MPQIMIDIHSAAESTRFYFIVPACAYGTLEYVKSLHQAFQKTKDPLPKMLDMATLHNRPEIAEYCIGAAARVVIRNPCDLNKTIVAGYSYCDGVRGACGNDIRQKQSVYKSTTAEPQPLRSSYSRLFQHFSPLDTRLHRLRIPTRRRTITKIGEVGTKGPEGHPAWLRWSHNLSTTHQRAEQSHQGKRSSNL